MSMRTRACAALTGAGAVLLGAGLPAVAQEAPAPERTAFYSAASGGGIAAPQPVANEGDLRISRTVRVENFATLLYRAKGARAALDLTIRDVPPPTGTPDVVACPALDADWKAGPNQPLDAAPEYDCSSATSFGALSEDGKTLSFPIGPEFQVQPGVWSIALVPTPSELEVVVDVPDVPLPFSLDLAAPAAGAFVAEPEFTLPDESETSSGGDTSGTGTDPTFADGSAGGSAGAPDLGGALDAGSSSGNAPLDLGPAPDVAVDASGSAGAGTTGSVPDPAIAGAPQAGTRLASRPVSAVSEAGALRRLLALLVLAGGCAALGFAAGQQRPDLRLLGGRARSGAQPAPPASPAGPEERPRGIGRFARVRDASPRRLT